MQLAGVFQRKTISNYEKRDNLSKRNSKLILMGRNVGGVAIMGIFSNCFVEGI